MEFEHFFSERPSHGGRNRTVNIPEELHHFYKQLSGHFDVKIGSVITNILQDWKTTHEHEIHQAIIKNIQEK